jgi:O-antigen/teichoic acid export membrane protein
MKLIAHVSKNIISNVLNFIISIVIPIFITPFLIHKLGDSHYGLWILINSVIGYYGILDLGITTSIVRYVSKYIATNDEKNLNSFVNTALLIFLLVGIVTIILSVVLSIFLTDVFDLSAEDAELFPRLLIVISISFALSFPSRTFNSILRGIQRYDIANVIDILCSIIQTFMVVYFLSQGSGLMSLGLITLLNKTINVLLSLLFAMRKTPMLRIDLKKAQKSMLKTIFGYSIFSFIWRIGDYLRFQTGYLIIGAFLPTRAITYYSIGTRLMSYYHEAILALCSISPPIFSSMDALDQTENIRRLLLSGTRYLSIISVYIGTSLILYGKPFITLWIGEGYESSYYIMLILALPYIMLTSQMMSVSAVYGIEKHKFLSFITLLEGVVNLGLSIVLVKHYGIYGVALGTAIPMLIINLFVQPVYVCRITGLPLLTYIKRGLLVQLLISVLYFIVVKIVISAIYPGSYIQLTCSVLLSFVFFAILAIVLCLNINERKMGWKWVVSQVKSIRS